MEDVNFQLPVTGYDVITRIIKGYLHAGADKDIVSVSSVADTTAMQRPNISANNKFLLAMGIIERSGKGYKLSSEGVKLAKYLDYYGDDADQTREAWRSLVEKNEFLQRVTSAVKVRGSMDIDAFARHIALTSGAPNKKRYLTGARTVIKILQLAGRIKEAEDGTLTAVSEGAFQTEPSTKENNRPSSPLPHKVETKSSPASSLPLPVTIMIHISSDITDQQIEEIAQKINSLMEKLLALRAAKNEEG